MKLEEFYDLETKSFNPLRDESLEGTFGLWESETQAMVDMQALKSLFFSEDWVYILNHKIASRIAGQKMRVIDKKTKKTVDNHPVNALLEKPNEFQDYYQWMYCMAVDLSLTGNAFTWKLAAARQLVFIPSELVMIKFNGDQPEKYMIIKESKGMNVALSEMGHVKKPNPCSVHWGLSPLVPGKKGVLFNRYSSEFLNNYYIKGAQPGLVIEIMEGTNEKEALRLLRSMELSYTGRKNQRRNMVLPKGVSAEVMQTSLADQQLKDYIELNRETIINLYEVPKHELSIAESGSLGSQEYKTAMKNFWTGPLRSMMDSIVGVLEGLLKRELGGLGLEFDLTDVECLQEDEHDKALLAKEMLCVMTPNEVRAKVYKMPPIEGGDKLEGASQPQQASQFQSFAMPQATVNPLEILPPVDHRALHYEKNLNLFKAFKSTNQGWWDAREEAQKVDFDSSSLGMKEVFLKTLAAQIDEVIPVVRGALQQKGYQGSKAKLKKELVKALDKLEPIYVDGGMKALESTVEVGYDTQLKMPFNLQDQSKLEAVRQANAAKRQRALEDRQVETFSRLNETTANNIMTTIDVGIEDNKTVQEITRDVARQFTDIENVKGRAETIARTETLTASSIGQWAAANDAAEVLGPMKKIWINAGDERVRQNNQADHVSMQGQTVNHDKPFKDPVSGDRLMVPRDPSGKAASVINCRCTFVLLPAKEAANIGIENFHGDVE